MRGAQACRVSGVYARQSCEAISLFLCFNKTWPVACLVRSACRPKPSASFLSFLAPFFSFLFGCVALLVPARRWPVVNHLMLSADWVSPLVLSEYLHLASCPALHRRQSCHAISLFLCFNKTRPVA